MKVRWWERLLVEWAALVMDNREFSDFLDRYGFEIDRNYRVVRASQRRSGEQS